MALPNIQVITRKNSLIRPIEYGEIGNSFLYLNERHDKAQEAIAKNNLALSELLSKVNPSEAINVTNRFNQYMDKVNTYIDPNSGYAGNALSAAMRIGSEAAKDYYFIGRVKYQADREAEKNLYKEMAAKGLIHNGLVDMWDELNPYDYVDIKQGETEESARKNRALEQEYNENPQLYLQTHNGELPKSIAEGGDSNPIVNGAQWKSNFSLVKSVDLNELWDKAVAAVAEQGGATTRPVYRTADGKDTYSSSEADPSNPYPWFIDTNQNVIRIGEDKLKKAMRDIIASTPGARESIEQDLKYGLFNTGKKYKNEGGVYLDDNGKIVDNEFTDDGGLALDYDTYLDSIIDSGARIRKKSIGSRTLTPSKGMDFDSSVRLEELKTQNEILKNSLKPNSGKAKNSSSGSGSSKSALYDTRLGLVPVDSNNKRLAIEGLFANQKKMDIAANDIITLADAAGITYDNNTTIEELWGKIPNQLKTDESQAIYDNYVFIKNLIDNNVAFNENVDAKSIIDDMRLMAAHDGGYSITKDNSHYDEYMKNINKLFIDKDTGKRIKNIYVPLQWANHDFSSVKFKLDKAIPNLKYDESGKYLILTDNDRDNIPAIINIIEGYEETVGSQGYNTGIYRGSYTGSTKTLHFDTQYKGTDGKMYSFNRDPFVGGITGNTYSKNFEDIYNRASKRVGKLMDGEDNSIKYSVDESTGVIKDYVSIKTQFVPFTTFGNAFVANSGADKGEIETDIKDWITSMKNYVPTDNRLFIGLNDHDAIEITNPDDRRILWNIFKKDKALDDLSNYGYDPLTYDPKIHIDRSSIIDTKKRSQINSIINKYLEESGLDDDIKQFSMSETVDIIMPDIDNRDPIKAKAMESPDYKGNLQLMQYNAAKIHRVPITNNVILDTNNNSIVVNNGRPIQLAVGSNNSDGVQLVDNDAAVKMILAYSDGISEYQKAYARGQLDRPSFRARMEEFISVALGKDTSDTDVRYIVEQMIKDTKIHYNMK